MADLKKFRKANNLTQDELGAYLDMKKSFISKIENKKEKLPQAKLQKLLSNSMGWDTAALTEKDSVVGNKVSGNDNIVGHHNIIEHCEALNKLVEELSANRKQMDKLIHIIAEQMEIIKNK